MIKDERPSSAFQPYIDSLLRDMITSDRFHQHDAEIELRRQQRAAYSAEKYTGDKCTNCRRDRVLECANGKRVCEKCSWDQVHGAYDFIFMDLAL